MGFYFRRSQKIGPIRLNFSKSGMGVSTGITGARLIFSPKGTYVHLGRNGFYYKKKISFTDKAEKSNQNLDNSYQQPENFEKERHSNTTIIETVNFDNLTDVDSQEFIHELEVKDNKASFASITNFILIVCFAILLFFLFKPYHHIFETQKIALVLKDGVNIRESNSTNANILSKANRGQEFIVVNDTIDSTWIQISFNGQLGFVYSNLVALNTRTINEASTSRYDEYTIISQIVIFIFFVISIALIVWANRMDRKRKTLEINYELDDEFNEIYQNSIVAFKSFMNNQKVWHINSKSIGHDKKYHGGASTLVTRQIIDKIELHKLPLKFLVTNAIIPYVGLKNIQLYFFPERLLVKQNNKYASIMYKNLIFESSDTSFVEDDSVPRDAKIIEYTWKYLNKKGGPDKRFSNNKQIPVCLYTNYFLQSENGLNEVLSTSRTGGMDEFEKSINRIKSFQINIDKSEVPQTFSDPIIDIDKLFSILSTKEVIRESEIQNALLIGFSSTQRIIESLIRTGVLSHIENSHYKIHHQIVKELKNDTKRHLG